MFREPGPCAACGVSIVSILSTDNKTPHSNVKCPFRQLSLHSVRSLHNVHSSVALPLARRSHALRCLSVETYCYWRRTGLWTRWTLDGSPVPQSPVWRQSGLVVRTLISVIAHRTWHMRPGPRASLRRYSALRRRRSHCSHMSELSRAKLEYNVLKTLETRVAQGCQGVHGLFVLLRIIRRGRIGFHATPRAQEWKVER